MVIVTRFSFAQSNNSPAMSQKAIICLNASEEATVVARDINGKMYIKFVEENINKTDLPITQKYTLLGLAKYLSSRGNPIDEGTIGVNYYLSCMFAK